MDTASTSSRHLSGSFARLWAGETVSLFGSKVTELAMPLTALFVLGAGPGQLGLLTAAGLAPFWFFTLPAGLLADRVRRRPLLLVSNFGRAALLGAVPVLAAADALTFGLLLVLTFSAGSLAVLFEVAFFAYVPALLDADELVTGNSRIQASQAAAQVGGPAVGGLLVTALTAPVAVAVDALSFLLSGFLLLSIRRAEEPPEPSPRDLRAEVSEGFRAAFASTYVRALAAQAATFNFFSYGILVVFLPYATIELGFSPTVVGLFLAAGGVGSVVGSLVAPRLSDRLPVGRVVVLSVCIGMAPPLLLGAVAAGTTTTAVVLAGTWFLIGLGVAINVVTVISIRQASTPRRLLGRANASYRLVVFGAGPFGALAAGAAGEAFGLRATLLGCGTGMVLGMVLVCLSLPGMTSLSPSARNDEGDQGLPR